MDKVEVIIGRAINAQRIMSNGIRRIDEISVLFQNESDLDLFKDTVTRSEWNFIVHSRSEKDWMRRLDAGRRGNTDEEFDVRFEFFMVGPASVPQDQWNWRIEAMCVVGGEAPLHFNALGMYGSGAIFHASYKLPLNDGEPERLMYDRAVDDLGAHGWRCRAAYENSYGRFSYWGDGLPYLKPRCNLRDSSGGADTAEAGTLATQQ